MTRLTRLDRPRVARVLASVSLHRALAALEARGDWCTRCGQQGHVAASCKVKIPPVADARVDRPAA